MTEALYLGVVPKQCFDTIVFDQNVSDFDCWKLLISKALGLGILVASVLLKAPQIVDIVANGSTLGLVASGFYLETLAYTSSSIFNLRQGNPFTTWGEVLFIWVQNVILVLLLWYYTKARATVSAGVATTRIASNLPPQPTPYCSRFFRHLFSLESSAE